MPYTQQVCTYRTKTQNKNSWLRCYKKRVCPRKKKVIIAVLTYYNTDVDHDKVRRRVLVTVNYVTGCFGKYLLYWFHRGFFLCYIHFYFWYVPVLILMPPEQTCRRIRIAIVFGVRIKYGTPLRYDTLLITRVRLTYYFEWNIYRN